MRNWQDDLKFIQLDSLTTLREPNLAWFKEKYPGNYKVEWAFSKIQLGVVLTLVFENELEETWWKIKNSS